MAVIMAQVGPPASAQYFGDSEVKTILDAVERTIFQLEEETRQTSHSFSVQVRILKEAKVKLRKVLKV